MQEVRYATRPWEVQSRYWPSIREEPSGEVMEPFFCLSLFVSRGQRGHFRTRVEERCFSLVFADSVFWTEHPIGQVGKLLVKSDSSIKRVLVILY